MDAFFDGCKKILSRHRLVVVQVHDALDQAIQLPQPCHGPDQEGDGYADEGHEEDAAQRHPYQIPPEGTDLPAVMAVDKSIGAVRTFDVIDDQRDEGKYTE